MRDYRTEAECPACHEHHVSVRYEDGPSEWTYGACTTAQRELTADEKEIAHDEAEQEFWPTRRTQ